MARRHVFSWASRGRRVRHRHASQARRLAIEPLEDRRLLSASSLHSQVSSNGFNGAVERPDEFAVAFSDDGVHAYVTGRDADALIFYRRNLERGYSYFEQSFEQGFEQDVKDLVLGPLLRAEVTPLADGSIAYDIFYDVNSELNRASAIDLKFSGNIVQLPFPVTGAAVDDRAAAFFAEHLVTGATVADRPTALLAEYLDPDFDSLGDSWFYFGAGTSWVADLPTSHDDHPQGRGGYGLAEVDGAMFIAAGSGASSQVDVAAVAHIVVAPTAENPEATLNVFGAIAWQGMNFDVSGSFDSDSSAGDAIVSYVSKYPFGGMRNQVDGLDGASSVALSPDERYVYVTGEEDNTLVVFGRDQASGKLVLDQIFREGDVLPDGRIISGLAGASGVYVSDDGAEIHITGSAEGTAVLFRRDLQGGAHEFVDVVEWPPPEPPPEENPLETEPPPEKNPLETEPPPEESPLETEPPPAEEPPSDQEPPTAGTQDEAGGVTAISHRSGPLLTAEVTPLADGSVAYDIYFDVNSDRHSAVAIDLKFSGNIVQLPSPITALTVADRATAFLAEYLDPDFDPLGDSWFYFGTGTSWVADLPTMHEDHPEGFAGLGLAEVDGAMFIAAGSEAGSNIDVAAVAHIVVAPSDENPAATLTISGILAWEGEVYDVSGSFDSGSGPDDVIVSRVPEVSSSGEQTEQPDEPPPEENPPETEPPPAAELLPPEESEPTGVVDGPLPPDESEPGGTVDPPPAEPLPTEESEPTGAVDEPLPPDESDPGGTVDPPPAEPLPPEESEPTDAVDEPLAPDEGEPTDIIDPPPAESVEIDVPTHTEPSDASSDENLLPADEIYSIDWYEAGDDVITIQPWPIVQPIFIDLVDVWIQYSPSDATMIFLDLDRITQKSSLLQVSPSVVDYAISRTPSMVLAESISIFTASGNAITPDGIHALLFDQPPAISDTAAGGDEIVVGQIEPVHSIAAGPLAFATLATGEISGSPMANGSGTADRIAAVSPIVAERTALRQVFVSRPAARASGVVNELSELRAVGRRSDSEGAESFWDRALEELLADEEPDGGWFTF